MKATSSVKRKLQAQYTRVESLANKNLENDPLLRPQTLDELSTRAFVLARLGLATPFQHLIGVVMMSSGRHIRNAVLSSMFEEEASKFERMPMPLRDISRDNPAI